MSSVPDWPFSETIHRLRTSEEILLFTKTDVISNEEKSIVTDFLELEYRNESLNFPGIAPPFDEAAALWAATVIYTSSRLLLYRDESAEQLAATIPDFPGKINHSAILSADLCLRFLPYIITQALRIDAQDPLILHLETMLQQWHYSGINYRLEAEKLDFETILSDNCLKQLYSDRVIQHKAIHLCTIPEIKKLVQKDMGNWSRQFWHNS